MKRFFLFPTASLLLGLLITPGVHAQGVEWAKLISDNTSGWMGAICRDSSDNVYVTGRLGPNAQVDGNPIGVQGVYDMFLIKFNAAGEFQWSQRGGGGDPFNMNEGDWGHDLDYDPISNAVYVCGTYEGYPATFGGGISFHGKGAFLAKYSTGGECLWVRRTDHGAAISVHVDTFGDIVISGGGSVTGFPPPPDSTTFFANPDIRIANGPFIAKYAVNGDLIWAKKSGNDIVAMATSCSGRTVLYGWTGPMSDILGAPIALGSAATVGFVAEVDSEFTQVEWLHQFSSPVLSIVHHHAFVENG
ncbi:MAG TPA: hypothetical protein PLL18_16990, partial [Flavobacteriales bacterium]|nr:hypothetical protein [Flavobacteriales bacterium]